MSKSQKRLENEFKSLTTNPICNCIVELPDPNNIHKWVVHMSGPEGCVYESGVYSISFVFPENYPFKHPDVKFITPMYHPNIKKDSGEICMDVFASSWSPTQKVKDILEKLVSMIKSPSTDSPLEPEICQEFMNNHAQFEKKVKMWIKNH
jgi:ubiquitin-protein ligase